SYKKALERLKRAEETSNMESEEEGSRKRKRTQRGQDYDSENAGDDGNSTDDDGEESIERVKRISLPKPPEFSNGRRNSILQRENYASRNRQNASRTAASTGVPRSRGPNLCGTSLEANRISPFSSSGTNSSLFTVVKKVYCHVSRVLECIRSYCTLEMQMLKTAGYNECGFMVL
ncbi:Hypothetical predicted protein, partial [Paramuricea clavata]